MFIFFLIKNMQENCHSSGYILESILTHKMITRQLVFISVSPCERLPDTSWNDCPYEFCPESRTEIKFYRINLHKYIYREKETAYTKCMCTNHTDCYVCFTVLGFLYCIWFETYSYEVKQFFLIIFKSEITFVNNFNFNTKIRH